jgi:hypothetical protein
MTIRRKKGGGLPLAPSERKAAVERVIEAVGSDPDSREQLVNDIDAANHAFAMFDAVRRTEPRRKQEAERIAIAIRKLESLLDKYPHRKAAIGATLNFKGALAALAEPEIGPKLPRRTTPIEYLVGVLLPRIFEDRFRLPSKWTRRGGIPDGKVIDFIQATIGQLGVQCSRETIGSALSRMKPQRLDLDKFRRK